MRGSRGSIGSSGGRTGTLGWKPEQPSRPGAARQRGQEDGQFSSLHLPRPFEPVLWPGRLDSQVVLPVAWTGVHAFLSITPDWGCPLPLSLSRQRSRQRGWGRGAFVCRPDPLSQGLAVAGPEPYIANEVRSPEPVPCDLPGHSKLGYTSSYKHPGWCVDAGSRWEHRRLFPPLFRVVVVVVGGRVRVPSSHHLCQ